MANVAVLLGEKTAYIVAQIKKSNDSFEFFEYSDITKLIKDSMAKQVYFDRILLSERVLSKRKMSEELSNLNKYISENSESTKVILLLPNENNPANAEFMKIFNAPSFVTVTAATVSVPILIELLSEDTEVIRANYHRDPKEMPKEEPAKKKSLFGKPKKEEAPKTESTTTPPAPQEAAPQQSSLGAYAKMPGAGVSVQVEQESASVSDDNDMDNDLDDDFGLMSLGGYGNRHTDTGYLDDYSYDDVSEQSDVAEEPEEEEIEEEEEEIPTDENAISLIDYNKFNGIVLVTGERGVGVTKFVIETAVALYNGGRGKKVLIVDCDYKRNGALSYIEVEDFYAQECYNGIEKVKFYHDIEADIISNGYGVPVTKQQIYNLLHNSNLDAMYDVILVDCPTDCLNSISERAIKSQKVIVLANGDRGSLMATSIALTDKSIVEGPLQRYIMRTCTPGIGEYSEHYLEDVEFVRRIMFFPDGCWLDNLGIEE